MPDTNRQDTLDTNPSELRLDRFEAAWMNRKDGDPAPDWRQRLPTDDEPCRSILIFDLLQMDIEYRVKSGLTALLAESYFEHPRLQQEDARLSAEQMVELIRWEYQLRRQIVQPARRAEYQAAFPQHADALHDLKAIVRCPRCEKIIDLDEDRQTLHCPDCDSASPSIRAAPPSEYDPRTYQLIEQLGKGGMGEVYRCCDPALGRDLAIKVVKERYRGDGEMERRFLREARITGSLQHPGIVPIHNLGRLADGRLHYTMRPVRGKTFADILKEEASKPERLPYLLTIFEKICQAVAYAHSKRVIHRDLKPANVMVGRFGEVQVMDWGLAKLLAPGERGRVSAPSEAEAPGTIIHDEWARTELGLSRSGAAMGTLAYMPPEQARGKWDKVDERADVFALGSILCEMLTGQPAHTGAETDLLDRVERGDVTEALERLQRCGADAPLMALCRECLSPRRDDRPRDAAAVAKRLAEYQAAVQERLRRAELERVAAESRAKAEAERAREAQARVKAERRAKRRMLALAVAVMLLIAGGGGATWWKSQKQEQADREALASLERARERLEAGWRSNDVGQLSEALAEAERAVAIARNGRASDAVEQQVAELQTEAQELLARAKQNQELLRALLDIAIPHETKTYRETESDLTVMALAEPSVEAQYANAFRLRWPDVDIDKQPAAEVAVRLQQEPERVREEVIASLDAWMVERRRQQRPETEWRRLLELVERLDASEEQQKLRALLIGSTPPSAASVVGLFAASPPWPALWELARGKDWRHLRQLRSQMNAAEQPVMTVLLLAQASSAVGDMAGAEEVLNLALARRPDEVALLDALGKLLKRQGRLKEAIGCYRAARAAKHPELGIALGQSLVEAGKAAEGETVLRDLVRQQPNNPDSVFAPGGALYNQKRYADAEAACNQAIYLNPEYAEAYSNLGVYRFSQGRYAEAEEAYRKAIELKPTLAKTHNNLGIELGRQKKYADAVVAFRKANDVNPEDADAFCNLGNALNELRRDVDAELACRKAIALKPDFAQAYYNLGFALSNQRKFADAESAFRNATDLMPDYAEAYSNLGFVLGRQERYAEAVEAYKKALALKPDFAVVHCNLGFALKNQGRFAESLASFRRGYELESKQPGQRYPFLQWVRDAERLVELEKKLPAILTSEATPSNPGEAVSLAWMCQQPYQKRYAASARFYADAFAAEPRLTQQHRYNAACSAILAAAGQGEDARSLPDKTVVMFRRWALTWLRDDLKAYARRAQQNDPKVKQAIVQQMAVWRRDADLASVRDPSALGGRTGETRGQTGQDRRSA